MKLELLLTLLLLPGVMKFLLLLLLMLSCVMKLPLVFLLLVPPCAKLLLLGGLCFTSSLLAEDDAIEVLLASTSLGNKSWMVFHSTVLTVQDLELLINCRHLGHRFPHLAAACFKHFMQKL